MTKQLHEKYKYIRSKLDKEFDIKEWKSLRGHSNVDYLGMQWTQFEDATVEVNMIQYVNNLSVHQMSDETPES